MGFIKKNIWILILVGFILSFFWQFFAKGLLPIPSDTIVGLYHPFFDLYAAVSPQGVPFQNFLITDPIRQIIPWKSLVIDGLASFSLPLWNPYEMAGKPLLANFQSGAFYPLNLLLFIKPFQISWSIFIILQPLLAGVFMFAYLKNLKLDMRAALLGSVSFALGGFSIVWLEWGNIIHTVLWLPLILLSIDKLVSNIQYRVSGIKNIWSWIFLVSLVFSFFAGYLQAFFYVFLLSLAYLIFRFLEGGHKVRTLFPFIILYSLFIILTFVQWYPTLQFINLSARAIDQTILTSEGWFIPYQNLIQFVVPDFFGNPATLNYWGVWNYAEFSGYIGVLGLFFAALSLFAKKQKEVFFFAGVLVISLVFATANFISVIPFNLSIPFISSAQPTRLIFAAVFCLSILCAFGFNAVLTRKIDKKWIFLCTILFAVMFGLLWLIAAGLLNFNVRLEDLAVAKRNLILPGGIFAVGVLAVLLITFIKVELTRQVLIFVVIALSMFDLFRFGAKFTPFTNPSYFFPQTKAIEFLQKQEGVFRIAATDSRILAPNIATYYKLQSIEGYDPLYLKWYAELIASSERSDHSIKPPFGFNRIITPRNMDSPIIDLLNVKYVLSFTELSEDKFSLVFSEGQTKIYENKMVMPRAFFVEKTIPSESSQKDINKLFELDLRKEAIVGIIQQEGKYSTGSAEILSYEPNKVVIETNNKGYGFLVLTDTYYPTWSAYIDGERTWTYDANHAFRGVPVPEGRHVVEFKNHLFSL